MSDKPENPPTAHEDPDERDLPPGTQLPDRQLFIRGQHLARGVTALIALIFLAIFYSVFGRDHPTLYASCIGLILASTVYHFYRFFRTPR